MLITVYRPDPADGPWIMELDSGARLWAPDPETRAWLEAELGAASSAQLTATWDDAGVMRLHPTAPGPGPRNAKRARGYPPGPAA